MLVILWDLAVDAGSLLGHVLLTLGLRDASVGKRPLPLLLSELTARDLR